MQTLHRFKWHWLMTADFCTAVRIEGTNKRSRRAIHPSLEEAALVWRVFFGFKD